MKPILVALMFAAILSYGMTSFAAGNAAAGKDVFNKKCASCHGQTGQGNDTIAKMLKVDLRPLGSKEVQAKSDADMKKYILEGNGKMKPVQDVDAKQADDVIAFVRTLAKK
jgi:mono/diheme cytochrome c family protein